MNNTCDRCGAEDVGIGWFGAVTPTDKRIEVVKLLHELRQDGETTGDVFLRGLRALKALPEIERVRDEWCDEYVDLRDHR